MQYDRIHLVRIFKPNHGGMELIVNEIIRIQKSLGLKVAVVTSGYLREGLDSDYKEDVTVYRLPFLLWDGIILPKSLKKLKLKCQTLHIHGMDPFVDLTRFLISYDTLQISPHGGFFHTKKFSFLKNLYLNIFSKNLYKGINSFCISHNDMELSKRFKSKPIYMGCGFEKRELEINEDANDILVLGRISQNKRVDKSIKISQTLFPQSIINVVGFDEIGLMTNTNFKGVNYHGILNNEELKILTKKCRYFVMMSSYEGLGMTLIEALHNGIICIVSDIISFRLLCSKLDPVLVSKFVVFAKNISNTIELPVIPTKEDIKLIRKNIEDVFSWENVVKTIEDPKFK